MRDFPFAREFSLSTLRAASKTLASKAVGDEAVSDGVDESLVPQRACAVPDKAEPGKRYLCLTERRRETSCASR